MIVGVDVGNTAIKVITDFDAPGATAGQVTTHRIGSPSVYQRVAERIGLLASSHETGDEASDAVYERLPAVRIAAVSPLVGGRLTDYLQRVSPGLTIESVNSASIPMDVQVDAPENVGIDRLLDAFAAYRVTRTATVVVDAGSAVTVDWVDEAGAFQGGCILPGLMMQLAALQRGTELLPSLDWDGSTEKTGQSGANRTPAEVVSLPAKNTSQAILGGVLFGTAAAVDAIAKRYRQNSANASMLVTGGDAERLVPFLDQKPLVREHLACHALLDLPL